MATLTLVAVSARHGDADVVRDVDLAVADGEVLTVVGPSGSGKTTLLRAVAGLHPVSAGRIELGGREVTELDAADRNVSMVFQQGALFPHLSVAANIGFGLAVRRVPKGEASARVQRVAELVGCGGLLERRPDQLSGGERQRVALARALVREPDALLLDEPLSSLDAQLRHQLRGELLRLRTDAPTTTVHVTHDQVEALTLGDRVAVLHDGLVQQVARPTELWWRPANRFVATFLGTPPMNLLAAVRHDGDWVAGPVRVPIGGPDGDRRGDELDDGPFEIGVRPDDLALGSPEGELGIAGVVAVTEVAGGEAWVHVRTEVGELIARASSLDAPAPGTRVRVSVDPDRCFVFGADGATRRFARPPDGAAP